MNSILIGIILAGLGAGSTWYYRQEAIDAKIFYDSQIAEIEKKSEAERKLSEDRNNGIEKQRIADKKAAEERIKLLSRKLARPAVTSCSTSSSGIVSAHIDDSVVGVLVQSARDSRLEPSEYPACNASESKTVTADNLSEYAFNTIVSYNECASQLNSLIDVVGVLYKNSP